MMALHDSTIDGRDISTGWAIRHKKIAALPKWTKPWEQRTLTAAPVCAGAGTVFAQGKEGGLSPEELLELVLVRILPRAE